MVLEQQYRETPLKELKVHPRNARHGDVAAISESIKQNGFFGACVAQKSTGHILVGNHRYLAAKEQNKATLPVLWVDVDDDRAVKILLADNKTNDDATYDNVALTELLSEISNSSGLEGTGYGEDELEALLHDLAGGVAAKGKTPQDLMPNFANGTFGRQIILNYDMEEYAIVIEALETKRLELGAESYSDVIRALLC